MLAGGLTAGRNIARWVGAGAVERLLPMRVRGWLGVGRGLKGRLLVWFLSWSWMTVYCRGKKRTGRVLVVGAGPRAETVTSGKGSVTAAGDRRSAPAPSPGALERKLPSHRNLPASEGKIPSRNMGRNVGPSDGDCAHLPDRDGQRTGF